MEKREETVIRVVREEIKAQLIEITGFDKPIWWKKKRTRDNQGLEPGDKIELRAFKHKPPQTPRRYLAELMTNNKLKVTRENVKALLWYFDTRNWGAWEDIKLTEPYRAYQYRAGGKVVSVIIFLLPVTFGGITSRKWKRKRTPGHLKEYEVIP